MICNRLPDTEIIFWIDIQNKISLLYAWDKEKKCYLQGDGKFLMYTRNCEKKVTISTAKSSLKNHHDTMVLCQLKSEDL